MFKSSLTIVCTRNLTLSIFTQNNNGWLREIKLSKEVYMTKETHTFLCGLILSVD